MTVTYTVDDYNNTICRGFVHPASLSEHGWESAVEYAMEMTQSLYPNHRVELDYVKEYD